MAMGFPLLGCVAARDRATYGKFLASYFVAGIVTARAVTLTIVVGVFIAAGMGGGKQGQHFWPADRRRSQFGGMRGGPR